MGGVEMTSTKTVNWVAKNGSKMRANIEVYKTVNDSIVYADGDNHNMGQVVKEGMVITVFIEGHIAGRTYSNPMPITSCMYKPEYIAQLQKAGAYANLMDNIFITEQVYNELMDAINEAANEVKSAEPTVVKKVSEAKKTIITPVVVPADAVRAYKEYNGNADRAFETEDSDAYFSIRQWGKEIRRQGLNK
jgi:hypothetical protein